MEGVSGRRGRVLMGGGGEHGIYSKALVKVNHTEKRGRLPLLKYWSFLGTRVISLKHLVGPPCETHWKHGLRAGWRKMCDY